MSIKSIKGVSFHRIFSNKEIAYGNLKADIQLKSPDGKYVIYTYGTKEPRMGYAFGNVLVAEIETCEPVVVGEKAGLVNWGIRNPALWSNNSEYLVIDIYPAIIKYNVVYRSGKLILDMKLKRYTIVMIAGGFFYNSINTNSAGKVILFKQKGEKPEPDLYMHIDKAETHIDNLKWAPLEKFNDAVKLLEKGYFGNVLGYVNDEINIRFKKGFTPWPYKDAGIK